MGIDYRSGVFYGTFAKDGTEAHDRLRGLCQESIEAELEGLPLIRLVEHGNSVVGEHRYSIEHGQGYSFASRGGGHRGPIGPEQTGKEDVVAAIKWLGLPVSDFEPIGVYIYQDVF